MARRRDWVCWGVVAASWIFIKAAPVFVFRDLPPPARRPATPRVPLVAVAAVVATLLFVVLRNRRVRAWLRIRPRLSRPSTHGDTYLEAFALKALLGAVSIALIVFFGWTSGWPIAAVRVLDYLPVLIAVGYTFVRTRSIRVPLAEWGWRRGRSVPRELSIGMVAGIVAWLARRVPRALVGPDSTDMLHHALYTTTLTPILEETLYRGMLYRHLRDRLRWLPAVLVSSAIFALGHSPNQMPYVYLGGLVYALLREWRGSLVAAVAAHAAMNLLSVADAGWLS